MRIRKDTDSLHIPISIPKSHEFAESQQRSAEQPDWVGPLYPAVPGPHDHGSSKTHLESSLSRAKENDALSRSSHQRDVQARSIVQFTHIINDDQTLPHLAPTTWRDTVSPRHSPRTISHSHSLNSLWWSHQRKKRRKFEWKKSIQSNDSDNGVHIGDEARRSSGDGYGGS